MYQLSIVTPPATHPITVDEARDHMRIVTPDQGYCASLIAAAHRLIAAGRDVTLLPTVYRLVTDSLDSGLLLKLPKPPLVSVQSLQYYNASNQLTTLDASTYTVRPGTPGYVCFDAYQYLVTYPRADAIVVTFTCGYANAAAVPDTYKHSIRLMVAHYYENREATFPGQISELPLGIQALLHAEDPCSWGG